MRRAATEIHLDKAREKKVYGKNISVAVLDTGISPHPDFTYPRNRMIGFYDAVNEREEPYDDNSHGTHVAGILGGNGFLSKGKYPGVAPKCNLIGVKVLDKNGNGYIRHVLKGIEWVLAHQEEYKIRIVNISISSIGEEKFSEESEFVKQVNRMWEKGMIVVASAGNLGPKEQTIGAPGNSRKIITVGCSDEAFLRGGRGPTLACVKKPDVVAPGNNIVSCGMFRNGRYGYIKKSGTSMSCPMVSGAIALLLEKYPNMSNLEVKIRLKNTVKDLGKPHASQGWGMLDIQRLI